MMNQQLSQQPKLGWELSQPQTLSTDALGAHGMPGLCPRLCSQVRGQISHLGDAKHKVIEAKKGDSEVHQRGKR